MHIERHPGQASPAILAGVAQSRGPV